MGLLGRLRRRKVPRTKVNQYRSKLAKGKIPSNEISPILQNLEKLEKVGMSQSDINTVVKNLISYNTFKVNFLKDHSVAIEDMDGRVAARITKTQ